MSLPNYAHFAASRIPDVAIVHHALDVEADRLASILEDSFAHWSTDTRDKTYEKAKAFVRAHEMWLEASTSLESAEK